MVLLLVLIFVFEVEVIFVIVLLVVMEFIWLFRFEWLFDEVMFVVKFVFWRLYEVSMVFEYIEEGMVLDSWEFDVKDMVVKDDGRELGVDVKLLFWRYKVLREVSWLSGGIWLLSEL